LQPIPLSHIILNIPYKMLKLIYDNSYIYHTFIEYILEGYISWSFLVYIMKNMMENIIRQSREHAAMLFAATLVFSFVMAAMPTSLNSLNVPVMATSIGPDLPDCYGVQATLLGSGTIQGTAGNDVIVGSSGTDRINGGGGNDRICGRGGVDTLLGGEGADRLFGGDGMDQLSGGLGTDFANGGLSLDYCFAESEINCELNEPAG
jgi:RTX calcium-binding nonapeptide repeat (4 copies)